MERAVEAERAVDVGVYPARHQKRQPRTGQPPCGVLEDASRRPIQPLDVVDRDKERAVHRELRQAREETSLDRASPLGKAAGAGPEERDREGLALRRGQAAGEVVEDGVEQVAERGERQASLCLGWPRMDDAVGPLSRHGKARLEERGLTRAGFAIEDDCSREVRDGVQECGERRKLFVSTVQTGFGVGRHVAADRSPPLSGCGLGPDPQ